MSCVKFSVLKLSSASGFGPKGSKTDVLTVAAASSRSRNDFAGEASRIRRGKLDVLDTRQNLQETCRHTSLTCIMVHEQVFRKIDGIGRATLSFRKDTSRRQSCRHNRSLLQMSKEHIGSMESSISTFIRCCAPIVIPLAQR